MAPGALSQPDPVSAVRVLDEVLYSPRVRMLSNEVERGRISGVQARNLLVREFLEFMMVSSEKRHLMLEFVLSEREQQEMLRVYQQDNQRWSRQKKSQIPLAAAALDWQILMHGDYEVPAELTFSPLRVQLEDEELDRFTKKWRLHERSRSSAQQRRREDLLSLLAGRKLTALLVDDRDPFRRFLRRPDSALRMDIDRIIYSGRSSEETFLSDQQILMSIEKRYPDWLRSFFDTPHQFRFELTSFLADWIMAATQDPWRYPKTWRYIQWRQGVFVLEP